MYMTEGCLMIPRMLEVSKVPDHLPLSQRVVSVNADSITSSIS